MWISYPHSPHFPAIIYHCDRCEPYRQHLSTFFVDNFSTFSTQAGGEEVARDWVFHRAVDRFSTICSSYIVMMYQWDFFFHIWGFFRALTTCYLYRSIPIIFQFPPNQLSFISSVDNYPYLSTMAVDNLSTYRFPFISSSKLSTVQSGFIHRLSTEETIVHTFEEVFLLCCKLAPGVGWVVLKGVRENNCEAELSTYPQPLLLLFYISLNKYI